MNPPNRQHKYLKKYPLIRLNKALIMQVVYKTLGKYFDTQDSCLKYEDKILSDKESIADDIALHYRFYNKIWGVALASEFTQSNRKFNFGKYKDCLICKIILFDFDYIAWCQSNVTGFELTENEQLLLNAISDLPYCRDLVYCRYPRFKVINLLMERYLQKHPNPCDNAYFKSVSRLHGSDSMLDDWIDRHNNEM